MFSDRGLPHAEYGYFSHLLALSLVFNVLKPGKLMQPLSIGTLPKTIKRPQTLPKASIHAATLSSIRKDSPDTTKTLASLAQGI
jgi:hypothetical protein